MPCNQRVYSDTHEVKEHIHSQSKCLPTLAAAITVTAGAGAWTLGGFSADIAAAGAITSGFDIHSITIENSNTNGTYELVIYYGATDIECARVRWTRGGVQTRSDRLGVISSGPDHSIIPANSRVRAKVAHSGGAGTETLDISIEYHEY